MSVFRFEANSTSSKPISKKMKAKSKEMRGPTFAFSTSPSLLQDITLEKTPESAVDVDDSCDSSSDIVKADYVEGTNYDSQMGSGSESQVDFAEVGMRNSASSGLTMKEYEEHLKKLTAENFNLKLRVYFVEERLSKVTGISDKEDLIKKNIQLKVTCESQLKELEEKQELLFEASKAFELLQKEHAEEVEKLIREKDKEICDWEEKFTALEATYNEIKSKFPNLQHLSNPEMVVKTLEDYEKQIAELESNGRKEEERVKKLENLLKDNQLELESYELKSERMESELDQRMHRIEELVDELEQKEHDLASANFHIRKLEDDLKSKQREDEIMKERIEEKNKTIESLKSSLALRYDTIEALESKIAKERASSQSMQSKLDGLSFQNAKLKEELDILQSRLRRTADALSPRGKGRSVEEETFKHKYEELLRTVEEQESQRYKHIKELEEKLLEKNAEAEDYRELFEKHKKLEDDHRKACTALKNFIKRSSDEKKEREVLNHILNNHEEVIADLKAQLDRYRNNSLPRIPQDDKLSLAKTGDNDGNFVRTILEKEIQNHANDEPAQTVFSKPEGEDFSNKFEKKIISQCGAEEESENMLKVEEKVIISNNKLKDQSITNLEAENSSKQVLVADTQSKTCGKEKVNSDLEKQYKYLEESTELLDKNRQTQREINLRDYQSNTLQNKLQECEVNSDSSALLECKLLLGVAKTESFNSILEGGVKEVSVWGVDNRGTDYPISKPVLEVKDEKKDDCEIVVSEVGCLKGEKDPVKICTLLAVRLEELAAFLDFLLKNNELVNGTRLIKSDDIKQVLEKSRELSRHLSRSFANRNLSDTSVMWCKLESSCDISLSTALCDSFAQNNCSGDMGTADKVISEQTLIINRLREQLKFLNQEIKQRDIELSRCQGTSGKAFDDDLLDFSDEDGIEKQTMSICQELSDEIGEYENEFPKEWNNEKCEKQENPESLRADKSCKKMQYFVENKNPCKDTHSHETSESEAWSEPDRSVSLARMGGLDDVGLNLSQRNFKCADSTDSSEGTLNENTRISGKRCRSSESEIRRLQCRVKALDEVNNHLRKELSMLKKGEVISDDSYETQKRKEEANLTEKLRQTMDRLEECSLACRQLEEKLAAALERASASAAQLSQATETILALEKQISQLKKEISTRSLESEEKNRKIESLESKIEEMAIESELKVMEALKQSEAAERKTLEVECKLKDAENMSKEVESKVNEIEQKLSETKKFKNETALHFKEAERHVDAAERMMEEAEKIKVEAERKSKDFQNFIDLMRKEVEEKLKEAERRIKKSEKEKVEMEKQVFKLKKKLIEAEKNKIEVEAKVKEGKETIQCMEEKLKELEVAMDQCNEEAQRKIKEMQKKADAKVVELEMKMEEREWVRKTELEKKMMEAEKISRELETGFKKQLEDAEKRVKKAKEAAESVIKQVQEDSKRQEAEMRQKIAELESQKKKECTELLKKLDEVKLEASQFELELTRLTNEKIHLEEELKRMLDKESALVKDNKEIKGKYENSIHELEHKLTQLALNKSHLASRLEEIESTNIDLVTRISAIRGKETMIMEQEFTSVTSPAFSPPRHGSPLSTFFADVELCVPSETDENKHFFRQGSASSDPGEQPLGIHSVETFAATRRNLNSSPDLGIESDPGRFSSLEANHLISGDRIGTSENSESIEMKKLECENAELRRRLIRTRQALEETLTQLSAANQRKKQVERAICKQLYKTHHILKKARVNFESQEGDSLE